MTYQCLKNYWRKQEGNGLVQPALAEGTLGDPMVQGTSSLLSLIVNKSIFIWPLSAVTIHYCRFTHDALS